MAAPAYQRYLLVVIDFCKWPEVAMCESPTSAAVIAFLIGLFDQFTLVDEIVTDNGVHFKSMELREFLKLHGIHYCHSTEPEESDTAYLLFDTSAAAQPQAGPPVVTAQIACVVLRTSAHS